ncbi:hypothetical protein Q5Y75_15145 [Ruegeria sp. 2205SS24-7]|uniref:hypothetical protein n=1 Tax=Ruegeria discodermiae TaxID=3064389 RepID=UPI0027428F79|nr:hypothetical protein [Ruegeria sp. 2205SS24-7]MDP5218563.1 hypothetical protein [Ruegeria sp. 2205SS24-7]
MSKAKNHPEALVGLYQRAWNDPAFRTLLDTNPKAALAELGGDIPDGVNIKCVMDTEKVKYLHITAAPAEGEISELDMMAAQGGTTPGCIATVTVVSIVSLTVSGAISIADTF